MLVSPSLIYVSGALGLIWHGIALGLYVWLYFLFDRKEVRTLFKSKNARRKH